MGKLRKDFFVQIRISESERTMIDDLKRSGDFCVSDFFRSSLVKHHHDVLGKKGIGVLRIAQQGASIYGEI